MDKHTPTPWFYDKWRILAEPATGVEVIALLATNKESRIPKQEANGIYIVKCVNAHEELLAAVKLALAESVGQPSRVISYAGLDVLRQAIAKAEAK